MKKKDDLEKYKDFQVADMNVEGMPWYTGKTPGGIPVEKASMGANTALEEPLSKKETGKIIGTALLISILVGAFFLGVFFLLILFCVKIWF